MHVCDCPQHDSHEFCRPVDQVLKDRFGNVLVTLLACPCNDVEAD
jgi:hypothetical protein